MIENKSLCGLIEQDYHESSTGRGGVLCSIARHSDARLLEIAEGTPVDLVRTTYDMSNEIISIRVRLRAVQFK